MASRLSYCSNVLREKWIWFEIYTSKLYKIKIKLENGEYKDWGSGGHFISEWKRQACLFNMKALA